MEFAVKARNKHTKKFVELLTPILIEELKLKNCRKFLLIEVSKSGPGSGNEGMTMPLNGLDSIVVSIQPNKKLDYLGATLAHEMVHVKQIAKGQLKSLGKSHYWNGKKFSYKSKYLYQPWEVEAFSKQELLFRRALDKVLKIDNK